MWLLLKLCFIGMAVAGAIVSALGMAFAIIENTYRDNILTLIFTFLVLCPLAIVGHELGPLVAGWSQGFRLYLLIVGPLKLAREGGLLRWRYNAFPWLPLGLVLSLPADDRNLRRRMSIFIAGGPLANV